MKLVELVKIEISCPVKFPDQPGIFKPCLEHHWKERRKLDLVRGSAGLENAPCSASRVDFRSRWVVFVRNPQFVSERLIIGNRR